MDNNDFIRKVRNFMDRFFAEWLILNNEYEKSITKELEEMEKQNKDKISFHSFLPGEVDLPTEGEMNETVFELLITYLKGGMSRMKLAEKLDISFSQLKIYLEEIEKMIIEEFKIVFGVMEEE